MNPQIQSQVLEGDELSSRHTPQIFGLAMSAVFVVILILNAIFY